MNALGLFGAFGTLFAAGYGLLALLVRRSVRLSPTEQIAFSWLFGTGAVSLLLWVFGFLADGLLLQGLVSVVCISLGTVGWKLKTPLHICSSRRNSITEGVSDPSRSGLKCGSSPNPV